MRIKIGVGNAVTAAYDKANRTVTFTGAYNWDIDPSGVEIYDTTINAWLIGNGAVGSITVDLITTTNPVTATLTVANTSTAQPLQTLLLSGTVAASASGDTLIIYCECPDDVAIYNSTVTHA